MKNKAVRYFVLLWVPPMPRWEETRNQVSAKVSVPERL